MSAPALAPWLPVFILALLPFPGSSTAIGAVSYWTDAAFQQAPSGGLSLLNPENGIFSGETTTLSASVSAYVPIVTAIQARNISVLGYVPTGYFNHSPGCDQAGVCQTWTRIEAQIQAYYQNVPTLNGIFFDEVAPTVYACAAFGPEYSRLRTLAHTYAPSNSAGTIAFNTAVPDSCAVDAATRGEIVVLYEDTAAGYDPASNTALVTATAHARASGVQSWHIVNTAPAWDVLVPMVKAYDPDWVYATNVGGDWQHGDNTYGAPPVYWAAEVASFAPVNATAVPGPTSTGCHSHGRKEGSGLDWTGTAMLMAIAAVIFGIS